VVQDQARAEEEALWQRRLVSGDGQERSCNTPEHFIIFSDEALNAKRKVLHPTHPYILIPKTLNNKP
jgi:hypothetical protein